MLLRLLASACALVKLPETEDFDRLLAAARAALGPHTSDAIWSEGAAMTLDQAIAHARAALAIPAAT